MKYKTVKYLYEYEFSRDVPEQAKDGWAVYNVALIDDGSGSKGPIVTYILS